MKIVAAGLLLALSLTPVAGHSATQTIPPWIRKAIAAHDRADQAAVDARRHPAEILTLAGVKPGDTVAELIPGGGYYTRLLSKIVGPTGHVYAIWPAEYDKVSHPDSDNMIALSKTKAYSNITVLIEPAAKFSAPVPVNLVFTSLNYHDYPDKFMGPTDPSVLDEAVLNALKPGGAFLVIDHVAADGSGLRDTETLHRIDMATVRRQVMTAGFDYVGSTAVLRNATDDHTKPVFDPAVRGHTDQFVLKFRKP